MITAATTVAPPAPDPSELVPLLAGYTTDTLNERLLDQEDRATATAAGGQSCIDAGSETIIALPCSPRRRLRLFSRVPAATSGCSEWRWWAGEDGRVDNHGWRRLYQGEPAGAFTDVAEAATLGNQLASLQRWQRTLGASGRLYSLTGSDDGPQPLWVGWQIDRTIPIRQLLERADLAAGLPAATPILESLLGYPPLTTTGPWSIAIALDGSRWRLGTTAWARTAEDEQKRQRLVATSRTNGGQPRFVEAVYKLLISGRSQTHERIGRAIEVELPLTGGSHSDKVTFEVFLSTGQRGRASE